METSRSIRMECRANNFCVFLRAVRLKKWGGGTDESQLVCARFRLSSRLLVTSPLEHQLQRKLDLPHGDLSVLINLAEARIVRKQVSGDSLIEFDHSSRTFQEPRGR